MKPATPRTRIGYRSAGGVALTIALAALMGGLFTIPARADDDHGRDVHQVQHRRPPPRRPSGYRAPAYVYAPPPVYYAPPQAPAIDLVFPLEIR